MKRARNRSKITAKRPSRKEPRPQPFLEHVYELRRRLFYVTLSVGIFSALSYAVERQLVRILLLPAKNQQFIYTSVGGGVDFLFRVSVYSGIALSIPVIVYQILKYISPLVQDDSMRFIARGSVVSGLFAVAGVLYGYFWGLPAALHFLLHQFVTSQIRPLVTIQSYMAFVTVYMLGSAMLFQVPLFMIFINRIRPLKPQKLFKGERWIILFAFLSAGIMNPTPNIFAQLLLAGPIILMYQVGIGIVYLTNRRSQVRRPQHIIKLMEQDAAARQVRLTQFQAAHAAARIVPPARSMQPSPKKIAVGLPMMPKPAPRPAPARPYANVTRPRRYVNDLATHRPPRVLPRSGDMTAPASGPSAA